ncbi:MAG: grhN, partial [Actinomycetota bacterium]|nr:grhN [Actinomycetota bacterium]
ALLEFRGRRSGRRLSVVVGWYTVGDTRVVFTPAPWRWNFAGGAAATVRFRGLDEDHVGTLELDPATVARALHAVIRAGTSPRALGLRVPAGHTVTADDVVRTRRAMVLFGPASRDYNA